MADCQQTYPPSAHLPYHPGHPFRGTSGLEPTMRGKGRRPGWSGRGVRLGDEPPSQGGTKVWRIRLAAVRCSVQREGRRGNRHGRGSAARTRVAAETGATTCRTGPETGPRRATITASPPDGRSGDRTYMTSDRGFQTARRSGFDMLPASTVKRGGDDARPPPP